jgi:hypothetical protein
MFHSYVSLPEGKYWIWMDCNVENNVDIVIIQAIMYTNKYEGSNPKLVVVRFSLV